MEAGDVHNQVAERALADLCRRYWPPIYTFVRRRGHRAGEAQDLTQAFFVHVLEKRLYTRADRARGRFRTFLLATLKHFLADAHAQEQALKRGGGCEFLPLSEELFAAESAAFIAPETAGGKKRRGRCRPALSRPAGRRRFWPARWRPCGMRMPRRAGKPFSTPCAPFWAEEAPPARPPGTRRASGSARQHAAHAHPPAAGTLPRRPACGGGRHRGGRKRGAGRTAPPLAGVDRAAVNRGFVPMR